MKTMKKTVVFNQKGGVGKSSITTNLAAISAFKGFKTLLIDLDPQANSSRYCLGPYQSEITHNLCHFFEQTLNFSFVPGGLTRYIHETPFDKLSVVPASPELETIQSKCESRHKIYKLRDAINQLNEFDAVYFDTPPAMNFYTRSALIAADYCLVPFDCDDFSKAAIYQLLKNIKEIQCDHNDALKIQGIIVNQFQAQAKLPYTLVDELKEDSLPVLSPYLSHSVKMRESHLMHKPLIYSAPKHKLTQELLQLYQTIESHTKELESLS